MQDDLAGKAVEPTCSLAYFLDQRVDGTEDDVCRPVEYMQDDAHDSDEEASPSPSNDGYVGYCIVHVRVHDHVARLVWRVLGRLLGERTG